MRKKFIIGLLVLLLSSISFVVDQVYAADDCGLTVALTATPSRVTSWDKDIAIKIAVTKKAGCGGFDTGNALVDLKAFFAPPGASNGELFYIKEKQHLIASDDAKTLLVDNSTVRFSTFPRFDKKAKEVLIVVQAEFSGSSSSYGTIRSKDLRLSIGSGSGSSTTTGSGGGTPAGGGTPSAGGATPGATGVVVPPPSIKSVPDFDQELGRFFNPVTFDSPEEFIVNVINIILVLVGGLSVLMILLGGVLMVSSAGNEGLAGKGRKTIQWAVLGLILSLLSFSIVAIIQSVIT